MSRCFPFPPPGYDKKLRPEEDLFQEEKQRERKHKKEKKSKRKRGEGDEKEERNKNREKQKEKKEKKDKHRDKKDKEKNKNKDKAKSSSSISVDATTAGQPETSVKDTTRTREESSNLKSHSFSENKFASAFQGQNGLSHIDTRVVRESADSKFVQELGRRIKDEGKAIGSQTVRSSTSDQRGYEEMHRSEVIGPQNSAKYMAFERDQGVDPKNVEGKGHKKVEEGKGLKNGLQLNGSNKVQNLTGCIDRKVETPPESVQRVMERTLQHKDPEPVQRVVERTRQEKDKCKEKSDDKRGEKCKDRDKKTKKSHGKDKGRDKEKKKEEKERTEHKKRDQDRSKELYMNDHSSSSKNNHVYSSQVDNKIVSTEENVKKRKDVEANGFGHENEIRSNKLRTHQLMSNGKILEACQSPGSLDSNRLCIPLQDKDKVVTKHHELNGIVGPQTSYIPKKKPPSAPTARSDQPIEALDKALLSDEVVEAPRKLPQAPVVVEASTHCPLANKVIEIPRRAPQASQIGEPLKKHPGTDRIPEPSRKQPPHPDLKYLNEVLSVPKMEEWSGVDDQEWLFSNKDLLMRSTESEALEKQKPDMNVDSRQLQVWSETLHIESEDIYALPYVIPY